MLIQALSWLLPFAVRWLLANISINYGCKDVSVNVILVDGYEVMLECYNKNKWVVVGSVHGEHIHCLE